MRFVSMDCRGAMSVTTSLQGCSHGVRLHDSQRLTMRFVSMDCRGAMSVTTSLQGCSHGVRLHDFASTSCRTTALPDLRCRLHQLSFVRVDCRLQRRPSFHSLERSSGYGATTLISCHKPLGCLASSEELDYEDDEGDAWLVDEVTTPFNQISVLELDDAADHELAGAYVLKLDTADLAHSVFWSNGKVWSGGCHDVFASLPPLLPDGPVAILGLGAGTVARLLLHIWPSLHLEGWELDSEVIRVARQYFALTDLESPQADANPNPKKSRARKKGRLVVHIGDALGPEATVKGGFAGIMVDIFINGTVCKKLAEVSTWRKLKTRLRPGGRIMVNCIPNCSHLQEESVVSKQWDELMHGIVRAMDAVFPGEISVRELTDGNNVMLLSGEMPETGIWSSKVPDRLVQGVYEWKHWDESHALWEESRTLNLEP